MRALIVTDIHANLVALETVLGEAAGEYDVVWCLGDVVGYGPRPNECVDLIREHATVCVMGNHEWAVLGRPGIDVDDFNPLARQAVLWTREELTTENRGFLDGLAELPVHPPENKNYLITHASPRDPVWEYVLSPSAAMENFDVFDEPVCLFGHTHKPAIYRWQLDDNALPDADARLTATVDLLQPQAGVTIQLEASSSQRLLLNPGSVGQPRDNDARAAYAILDLEAQTWQYRRTAYPIELTQGQMRAVGLPKRLIDRLSFGW